MAAFDYSVPIIIAGAGACGLVAALAARAGGAEICVLERDTRPGGCTALSQGNICAAGTRSQAKHGIPDNPDLLYDDIIAKTRGQTDHRLARAIADNAAPALDWLIDHHDLPWELDAAFRAAYGHSVPRVHSWLGRGGADMVDLLAERASAIGVDILCDARLIDLIANTECQVEGVVVERRDGAIERVGCEAVILATSGFSGNAAMVGQYMPDALAAQHNGHVGNQGDGIVLGAKLGGALGDMGSYQGYGMLTEPQGITVPPSIIVSGGFIVNGNGQRFVDETFDISGMVHAVLAQPQATAWVIFDATIEQACAYIPETAALIELNAARKAESVTELAQLLGVDPEALLTTFVHAHAAADARAKDAFGRRWDNDRPPSGSLRALKVVGGLYHTQGGLCVNEVAQVMDEGGKALPNLFAGGGAARGVSGPGSWGYLPAMGLCSAVTLGWLAGRSAARLVG